MAFRPRHGKILLTSSLWLSAQVGFAKTLTLDEFLSQVQKNNQALRSASAQVEASQSREQGLDQIFAPQLVSQLAVQSDEKPQANALAGRKTEAQSLSLGVQKLWEFGLQSQLTYQINAVSIERDEVPPLLAPGVPNPLSALGGDQEYKEATARLDLVQPLLKNWAGRELLMTRSFAVSRLSALRQGEQFKIRALLAEAEFVYWQLALAQEAVRTQEGSLARFQKIRDWVARRVQMSLTDKSDLLQAEAGVKFRRFELEIARRDKALLQRNFNSLRGTEGSELEGELLPLSGRLGDAPPPRPTGTNGSIKRLDVEAARELEKVAMLEVEQQRERFRPQLDLFTTLALNSKQEDQLGKAAAGAFSGERPTFIVGLKLSTVLDRDLINKERNGLIKASEASRLERESKEFYAKQEWENLLQQLFDAKTRLRLASELESTQKQKLDYEKDRLERGRTTTYQILLFEQDYASSQLGTIKAKADVLGILAKIKLFGEAL